MLALLIFLGVLFLVVLVHEGGHFLTAKLLGVRVEEFGFGLPPRLTKLFKKGETIYTLNWLPIGGFVRLYGEDEANPERIKNKKRAFVTKPLWAKLIILLAGVTANFLLAGFLFGVYYFFKGIPQRSQAAVSIIEVIPSSPASRAGLKEGDKIELIYLKQGAVVVPRAPEDVVQFVNKYHQQKIYFKIRRPEGYGKAEIKEVSLKPVQMEGHWRIGVVISPLEIKFYPWYKEVALGVWFGIKESLGWLVVILVGLKDLVVQLFQEHNLPPSVSGPVGIYKITSDVAQTGWLNLMRLIGVISVNLAVINLLPIPALDGGRALLAVISSLVPSKKVRKVEYWLNLAGMSFLLLLMILITIHDIVKFKILP